MAGQTAVTSAPKVGAPGEPSDEHTARNGAIYSATSEEASAEIVPGIMVQATTGSSDYGAKIITAITNKLAGISTRAHDYGDLDLGTTGYKPGATFGVGRKGRFFVRIEENVTPTSAVRVRCVATGNEVAGAFRATADSTDCLDCSAFAKWVRTSLAADGVGELEIDMSNASLAVGP